MANRRFAHLWSLKNSAQRLCPTAAPTHLGRSDRFAVYTQVESALVSIFRLLGNSGWTASLGKDPPACTRMSGRCVCSPAPHPVLAAPALPPSQHNMHATLTVRSSSQHNNRHAEQTHAPAPRSTANSRRAVSRSLSWWWRRKGLCCERSDEMNTTRTNGHHEKAHEETTTMRKLPPPECPCRDRTCFRRRLWNSAAFAPTASFSFRRRLFWGFCTELVTWLEIPAPKSGNA